MTYLLPTEIRSDKVADFRLPRSARVEVLSSEQYQIEEGYSIMGEAPKSFIRLRPGGRKVAPAVPWARRKSPSRQVIRIAQKTPEDTQKGPLYLAKTGHKWYPIESITEHLIARIGATLGLNMAHSRLVKISGQVKFLSKYFLEQDQELVHGIDILVAYLDDDRLFVEEIAKTRKERDFFTLEDTVAAIEAVFPKERTTILEAFFTMLCFDAWVGIQDRHFQNWAVVRDIYGRKPAYFSPIYDSARGLFWNQTEAKVAEWTTTRQIEQQSMNQINKSFPQLSLKDHPKIDHFTLLETLLNDHFLPFKLTAKRIFTDGQLQKVQVMIRKEFRGLLSAQRISLICKCLEIRHQKFNHALNTN